MITNTNVVVVDQRQPVNLGLMTFLMLAAVVALIVQYWWVAFIIGSASAAVTLVVRRFAAEAARQRQLIADADRQDRLFLAGDPRGIFGDFNEGSQQ